MSNTWFTREEKNKMTFRIGENETEIDLVLILKKHQCFIHIVKTIPGEFHHALVATFIDNKKIRNVVRKTCTE